MGFIATIKMVFDRIDAIVERLEDCTMHLENAAHSINSAAKEYTNSQT